MFLFFVGGLWLIACLVAWIASVDYFARLVVDEKKINGVAYAGLSILSGFLIVFVNLIIFGAFS